MTPESPRALTIVYTGHGKGKTTAAFGLALRMLGHGWRVLVLQFFKGPLESGERLAALRLAPDLTVRTLGRGYIGINGAAPAEEDHLVAARAWAVVCDEVGQGAWDAVILDEVNDMTALGLIPVPELLRLIETRPPNLTLVLTGRDADPLVCRAADIVTDMSCIKHVHAAGRSEVKGIDR